MVYWIETEQYATNSQEDENRRRVGFSVTKDDQQQHDEKPTMDDHLWRRELKSNLQKIDSHPNGRRNPGGITKKTAAKPSTPDPSGPPPRAGGKNVSIRRGRS